MKNAGQVCFRIFVVLMITIAILAIASPTRSATDAFQSDDFNRCSLNSFWTFENPANAPAAAISGAYSGDSAAVLTVPSGQDLTFSDKNTNAPRIMQPASDTSFELEVKFNTALNQTPPDTYNIQGILMRDTTSVPGKTKWLRFDLDTSNASINYYVGYIDENGLLYAITGGPKAINNQMNASPLYLRVKYDQPSKTWSLGYALTDPATFSYAFSFQEPTAHNVPGGFTFNITGLGIFAASTSPGGTGTPPGFTSTVDYIKSLANSSFTDDAVTLAVQETGNGTVKQECTGNQKMLTAVPNSPDTFTGWSGDVTGTQPTINLTMTQSYNVTAGFTGPSLSFKTYLPSIANGQ